MARSITRGIRLTVEELAWVRQATATGNAGASSLTDAESIRTLMYIGLDRLTGDQWRNSQPGPAAYNSALAALERQHPGGSASKDRALTMASALNNAASNLARSASDDKPPQGESLYEEAVSKPEYLADSDQGRKWELGAWQMIYEFGRTPERMLQNALEYHKSGEQPAEYLPTIVRFIQRNFSDELEESTKNLIHRILADLQVERS